MGLMGGMGMGLPGGGMGMPDMGAMSMMGGMDAAPDVGAIASQIPDSAMDGGMGITEALDGFGEGGDIGGMMPGMGGAGPGGDLGGMIGTPGFGGTNIPGINDNALQSPLAGSQPPMGGIGNIGGGMPDIGGGNALIGGGGLAPGLAGSNRGIQGGMPGGMGGNALTGSNVGNIQSNMQPLTGQQQINNMMQGGNVGNPGQGFQQMGRREDMQKIIRQQVQQSGTKIPASYFDRMAHIESRHNPRAISPTGAKGLYQFTGRTWKEFGQGDRMNPVNNTKAAIKFAEQNRNYLSKRLGREPQPHELYMAHNLGAGGASRLLRASPNATVTRGLIGSNPRHNPYYLTNRGRPITANQAINRYRKSFLGVK